MTPQSPRGVACKPAAVACLRWEADSELVPAEKLTLRILEMAIVCCRLA
jgi:hypothetical protein